MRDTPAAHALCYNLWSSQPAAKAPLTLWALRGRGQHVAKLVSRQHVATVGREGAGGHLLGHLAGKREIWQ